MGTQEIPKSVRIRCDEGNETRYYSIDDASDFYGVNNSDAVARACRDVVAMSDALLDVLDRDDLTREQRREIAERFDRATSPGFDVEVDLDITVGVESE